MQNQMKWAALALGLVLPGAAQAGIFSSDEPVRLNDIQLIGSHNSYKQPISEPVMEQIAKANPALAKALNYAHLPLADQLSLGLRQIEIDVYADPEGGRFAKPLGAAIAAGRADAPVVDGLALSRPGFKVFHVQDLDYGSHCAAFTACLQIVKTWSDLNPGHVPLFVTLNPKTESIGIAGSTDPLPFTPALFDALDAEIRSVLPPEKLLTPDDVRGGHITLESAVLTDGWPELDSVRGKIVFVLDAPAAVAKLYRADHPSLRGRAMFGSFQPGSPEAGIVVLNHPIKDEALIRNLVRRGYIVRTRSDADTAEARASDFSRFQAARASGAQLITTDYYPGAPDPLGLGFQISFEKGRLMTCNPVRTASACKARKLEPRRRK